ncbi:tol-pal system protein YbgF [Methylomonas sp. AM2-LC]|uniref:tol-pal system protein YbgF n=1 Tax=Methylomonas sp. AM2-LC TaxID=3153301 RepID=UPI0032677412
MRLNALLMLSLGLGLFAQAQAQPVDNSAYPVGGMQVNAPASSELYEVLSRVEQLQSEVQQLRGVVEEQSQTIADLQRKQSNMYSDLDGRVQALTPVTSAPPVPVAQAPTPAATVSQPATATAVPAAAAATSVAPAAAVPAVTNTVPVTASPTSAKGNEKERYQVAYDTLRNGHNEQAVKMFEAFLVDFPAGEFADNAQYWLGEAYKINRELDKARAAFNKLISQYPNSSKVPDALLKIGYIESDLQNNAKARDYLTRVTNSYPGTTAANLAAKKLAQMAQ